MSIFESDAYRTHLRFLSQMLNIDQSLCVDHMKNHDRLLFVFPTGTGKSKIFYMDMFEHFKDDSLDIFAVISHRLMLNSQHMYDLILEFKPLIGHIGYIYVGSNKFDDSQLSENKEVCKLLNDNNVNFKDILLSTTSTKEIKDAIDIHKSFNRDIVIVSTYHSLDKLKNIDFHTVYGDEAQMLASDKTTDFINNFKSIKYKRFFSFTATPKESFDPETEAFLMNNKDIFGERIELKFKDAVEKGYIVKPIIHLAKPSNYDTTKSFDSVDNHCRFITETFNNHDSWLKHVSIDYNLIGPKILVKCPDVDTMWAIYDKLVKTLKGTVKIFAGASRNDNGDVHQNDGIGISGRDEYLRTIKKLKNSEKAIVLHYDIFSEGISVDGLTGVMFISQTLPTLPKILQNIGRSTRLSLIDRKALRDNLISTSDYTQWVKPHCAVILPLFDIESERTINEISKNLKKMRDNFGFDPTYWVSEGDDNIKVKSKDDLENLNKLNKKKKYDVIDKINQEIEKLDNDDDMIKFANKINKTQTDNEKLEILKRELGL